MTGRPQLTKKTLEARGIIYDEYVIPQAEAETLPRQVQTLRTGLLSSRGRLVRASLDDLEDDEKAKVPAENNIFVNDPYETLDAVHYLKAQAKLALEISKQAKKLHSDKALENRWESLLVSTAFKNIEEKAAPVW